MPGSRSCCGGWEEEHAKLHELVLTLKTKAAFNDGLSSRYSAAQTRLRKFEEAGPPTLLAREQDVRVRLRGGRTAKRAVVATDLELTGLMKPFDLEVWFGERVAVLGSNGSGKSHFLRLLAAGGSDPTPEHAPADDVPVAPVRTPGGSCSAPACGRAGSRRTTRTPSSSVARCWRSCTGATGTVRGWAVSRRARCSTGTSCAAAAEQRYETLSGGQQARLQILLLELGGATLLLPGRADRQPRPALRRGARDRAGGVRGDGPGGHARPVVHADVRPVPRVRRATVRSSRRRSRSGRRPRRARPLIRRAAAPPGWPSPRR